MKLKSTLLLITITSTSLFAQNTKDIIGDLSSQTGRSLYIRPHITDPTIQKHYLSTEFKRANVEGFDMVKEYRYNGFTDNFEFLENDEVLNLVKSLNLKLIFKHNDAIFQYVKFTDDEGVGKERFLEVLIDNPTKTSLYKSFEVKEISNDNVNGYQSLENTKMIVAKDYFLGVNDKILQMPRSTKKINQILNFKTDEIIKSNNLNLKKQEDVIKLVEILNK